MTLAIVDERMAECEKRKLTLEGFRVIEAPASKRLPTALASHPDMLLFVDGKTIISSSAYMDEHPYFFEDISRLVPGLKIIMTDDEFQKSYPRDAIFNALVIGKNIFLKADTAARAVIDYAKERGLNTVSVNQGYPACVTLAVNGAYAITADEGMAKAISGAGISTLLIDNGDISLPPYEYGFIGGAVGVYKNKVYFIGDYTTHRDSKKIEDAIKRAGLLPVSLSDLPLRDLGRIIFIEGDI